jgi:DNA-binding Lrp family transcriptional regulator
MDELITLLRHNARASTADLAKELDLPEATVIRQIADLERDRRDLGYLAVIDPQKLTGAAVTAIIEVRITPERGGGFDRLAARIARFAEVQSCYLMSGGYDLLVVVEGDTLQQVATFISEKLSTYQGRHFDGDTFPTQSLQGKWRRAAATRRTTNGSPWRRKTARPGPG